MAERFILQCLNCHKILNEQPTKDEIGPEVLICPNCKARVPTPFISWRNAPRLRKLKLCLSMFGSTAGGVYLIVLLLVMPLLQNVYSIFGFSAEGLNAIRTRPIVYIYFPIACGLAATYFMRRHYVKYS